jgi:hypothetical protein
MTSLLDITPGLAIGLPAHFLDAAAGVESVQ